MDTNKVEKTLKKRGFDELCPSKNHHTFYKYPFLVIVYTWGLVISFYKGDKNEK